MNLDKAPTIYELLDKHERSKALRKWLMTDSGYGFLQQQKEGGGKEHESRTAFEHTKEYFGVSKRNLQYAIDESWHRKRKGGRSAV